MDASKKHIDEVEVANAEAVSLSIGRIKTRRVKVATKVNQRKSKFVSSLSHLKRYKRASQSTTSNEYIIPSIAWHAIFKFVVPILSEVVQTEKKESPLDTHPVQMQIFLMAICIYSTLLGIKTHTKACSGYQAQILSFTILLFGALSSVTLLSIMLQRQLLWVVLFIWGSLLTILARHLLKSSVCLMIEMVGNLAYHVRTCMVAKVVLIFQNKDSASGSNITYPANPVEGLL